MAAWCRLIFHWFFVLVDRHGEGAERIGAMGINTCLWFPAAQARFLVHCIFISVDALHEVGGLHGVKLALSEYRAGGVDTFLDGPTSQNTHLPTQPHHDLLDRPATGGHVGVVGVMRKPIRAPHVGLLLQLGDVPIDGVFRVFKVINDSVSGTSGLRHDDGCPA